MLSLRSLCFMIGQWLFTPLFSIIALLTFPFHPIKRNQIISIWARIMLWWLKITCNVRYEVTGLDNLPDHPSVILAKHQSAWETLAFQLIFPTQVYVMKESLLKIPFFGWGLAMTSPIAIDRNAGRDALAKLIRLGKERLQIGLWIVVFPEGTRMPVHKLGEFQIGGAILACKNQATVVPVAHNAGHFWPRNSFLKKPGTIRVVIGEAFSTDGLKPKAVNIKVEQWIQQQMPRLED